MRGAPVINTSGWRLPARRTAPAEVDKFSSAAYARVGLNMAQQEEETGDTPLRRDGTPTVDTSSWRLPRKKVSLPISEARRKITAAAISRAVKKEIFRFEGPHSPVLYRRGDLADDISVIERSNYKLVRGEQRPIPPRTYEVRIYKGRYQTGKGLASSLLSTPKEAAAWANEQLSRLEQSGVPVEDRPLPPKPKVESVTKDRLQRLAGIRRKKHLTFATGKPYRKLPEEEKVEASSFISEERPEPVAHQVESPHVMTEEMRRLAGMSPRVGLPHPVHDTRRILPQGGCGLLDEGPERKEDFVAQVLAESRWFFGEGPNPRSQPWQGSKAKPSDAPKTSLSKDKRDSGDEGKNADTEDQGERHEAAGERLRGIGGRMRALGGRLAQGTSASAKSREKHVGRLKKYLNKRHGIKFKSDD